MIGSMDTGICTSKFEHDSLIKDLDEVCTEETTRDVIDASATTGKCNEEASLEPITPDANRGIGELPCKLNSPPRFDPDVATMNQESSVNQSSPSTPKDGVFDPCAPGPEHIVLTLSNRKHADETRITVPRHHTTDAEFISDEEVFESVYENLLEVIVSNQAEDFLTEFSNVDCDSDGGGSKTPPSAPCLNEVDETCPGAPMKPSGRLRVIDLGLCRKLEF